MSDDKALSEQPAPEAPPAAPAGRARPVIKKRVGAKKRREDLAQPDEFMEVGGTIVDWVLERRKPASIIVGGILAALLVYGVVGKLQTSSRTEAAAALFEAQRQLPGASATTGASGLNITLSDPTDDGKLDEAITALDGVIAEFAGTPQATVAQLDAGAALNRAGEYERALPYFEAASAAGGTMGLLGSSSKASTLESLGRLDEALAAYESVRGETTGGLREQATIDLARVALANGDGARAKALYGEFETEFPDSALLAEVQAKAAAITP